MSDKKSSVIASTFSLGAIFTTILINQPLGAIVPAIVALTALASVFAGKK